MTKNSKSYIPPPPPREFPLSKIILTTVLAFSLLLASCGGKAGGDDTDDTGAQTGNGAITGGSNGGTISVAVKYDSGIPGSLLSEAKGITNFGYWHHYDELTDVESYKPISYWIPNSSVTVSNGNVTIKLGKVPDTDDWMEDMSDLIEDGLTVSDPSAKVSDEVEEFSTQDGKYLLELSSTDENKWGCLIYATKDVTITGTRTNSHTSNGATYTWTNNYNLSLKAGWNYCIETISGTEYNRTYTYTASQSQSMPSGFNWTVNYNDWWQPQSSYDPALNGTWGNNENNGNSVMYFNNGHIEMYDGGALTFYGTYTTEGNTIVLQITNSPYNQSFTTFYWTYYINGTTLTVYENGYWLGTFTKQ
jgi:hypothetical protein